ncbi:hypothetical protein BOX15_Mlig014323g2 [Macrostomum lignano]|uniref:ANK_REP_REGION domain-containing protein n=2 Tax=Macrostomum lignano TaxID=282301 RepID=A0A1I8HBA3_9PLAT|nr:hypothetical protein BOX15_Mlig014323g2 [Macrostomum lignano]
MTRNRERYHQAARDGYLDLLREATRSEADGPDENGMSPVMWAAFYGNVDALRLLIQRGGNPDKTDYMGSSALHFAALNGHMNCVTFLVNFGANIWILDNDFHTALDLAGLRDHRDIVEYLDGVAGKQVSMNRRVVSKMREKAALEAQKRVKKFDRLMRKTSKKLAKNDRQQQAALSASFNSSSSSASTMLRSNATSNPNYRHQTRSGTEDDASDQSQSRQRSLSFGLTAAGSSGGRAGSLSDLVGAVTLRRPQNGSGSSSNGPRPFSEYLTSARSNRSRYTFGAARKVVSHHRQQQQQQNSAGGSNKDYGDYNDGNLALSASSQSSDIVYARTSADGRSILSGPVSEPDMQQQQDAGLFERPGFGSVAFFHRHPRTAPSQAALMAKTLSSLKDAPPLGQQPQPQPHPMLLQPPSPSYSRRSGAADSIGTSGSLLRRWRDLPWSGEDLDNLEDDYEYDDDNDDVDGRLGGGKGTLRPRKQADLELFLTCLGLPDCMPALAREQIDLDSLSLCTDADLQTLGLPLGPRRKILEAMQRRRVAFERRDCLVDLRL